MRRRLELLPFVALARWVEPFAARKLGAAALAVLCACKFDASGAADGSASADESTTLGTAETSSSSGSSSTLTTSTTVGNTTEPGTSSTAVDSSGTTTSGSESSSSAEQGSSSGEPEKCRELLWVSNEGDPSVTTDAPLQAHLESLGYVITTVADDQVELGDADGQCAVLLSAVSDSADIGATFHDVELPVILWEYGLFDDMGFGDDFALDEDVRQIEIVDDEHPLAADLSGTVALYDGIGRINWANVPNATVVATRTDDGSHASLFFYETGDLLEDGSDAAGKRIVLPFCNATDGTLRDEGLELLEAAVSWAIES